MTGRDSDVDDLVERLVDSYQRDGGDLHLSGSELPSPTEVATAVAQCRELLLPGFTGGVTRLPPGELREEVRARLGELGVTLRRQVYRALNHRAQLTAGRADLDCADCAARAAAIVGAIGGLDIGQGAVVAQGLCLAVETLPGTDAMLDFAALHAARLRPDPKGGRGLLYKAPKPGQDRRIDLPTLGLRSVEKAAAAGLAGIAWEAGGVILLDRERMVDAAGEAGLFLWAREP